jgi:hypothetical protein
MENALVRGLPVALINVKGDKLSPSLQPLLQLGLSQEKSNCPLVKFGSRRVQVHSDFRLYFATSQVKNSLSAYVSSWLTVIDYSPAFDLVTETTLDRLYIQLCPTRMLKQQQTLETLAKQGKSAYSLENELIDLLAVDSTRHDIFTDLATTSLAVEKAAELAKHQHSEVDAVRCLEDLLVQRNLLYPLASTAATFFAFLNSLFALHHEYRFCIQHFWIVMSKIIQQNVQEEERLLLDKGAAAADYDANTGKQQIIPGLMKTLEKQLLLLYSRSLLIEDRLVLAFVLSFKSSEYEGGAQFAREELRLLIEGQNALYTVNESSQVGPDWLPPRVWANLCELQASPLIGKILKLLSSETDVWASWCRSTVMENLIKEFPIPALPEAQKMLIVGLVRPDALVSAAEHFVAETLGTSVVDVEASDINSVMEFVTNRDFERPVILLMPETCDVGFLSSSVSGYLSQVAKTQDQPFQRVRLGDRPEVVVEACIDTAQHIGGYMLIEEIHLVPVHEFPCLQKLLTMLESAGTDTDVKHKGAPAAMKIFLLTQPSHSLPPSLLLSCDIIALSQEQHQGAPAGESNKGLSITEYMLNRSHQFLSMVKLLLQTVQETSNLRVGQCLVRHSGRMNFSNVQRTVNFCLDHLPSPLPSCSAGFLSSFKRSNQPGVTDFWDTTSIHHPTDILLASDDWSFRTVSYVLVRECRLFNYVLSAAKDTLKFLRHHAASGSKWTESDLMPVAQNPIDPQQFLVKICRDKSAEDWIKDLTIRRQHMKSWQHVEYFDIRMELEDSLLDSLAPLQTTEVMTRDTTIAKEAGYASPTGAMWLGSLLSPSRFFAALQQDCSRWLGVSSEQVTFSCKALLETDLRVPREKGKPFVVLSGLFICNGCWSPETSSIHPKDHHERFVCTFPDLLLQPSVLNLSQSDDRLCSVPLFLSSPRLSPEEPVTHFQLPCEQNNESSSAGSVYLSISVRSGSRQVHGDFCTF